MAGFMNQELERIRQHLECGHCRAVFSGSDSQARKVKYEGRVVYCSVTCRKAGMSSKAKARAILNGNTLRKGKLAGPCMKCGEMFESRTDKKYCSMDCYTTSDQFREMQSKYWAPSDEVKAKISASLRTGEEVRCLECGEGFYKKRSTNKKFCSQTCYRSYLAKRFDRWVANPEGMALPQCYDEFLDREELACVVDGCNWKGKHLTLHMNQAHGVRSDEFKRATGFNLSTGVIARPLAEAYSARAVVGAAAEPNEYALELAYEAAAKNPIRYRSLEGVEHSKKARAMLGPGPVRKCKGCGVEFRQLTPMGLKLYCTPDCRSKDYAAKRRLTTQPGHPHR